MNPLKRHEIIKEPDLTREEFELFFEFIRENGGLALDNSKTDSLRIALLARITRYGFKNYKQYYYFLKFHPAGADEFKELLTYITVGETCFFRNPAHFKVLRNYILPEIIRRRIAHNQKYLNIWSAGCSTGDEAHSLAILVSELLPDYREWKIDILGTDVSKNALATAAQGSYRKYSLRLMENSCQEKYFSRAGQEYVLREDIKNMVEFRYFNLVKEPYPLARKLRKWDIIFCCNVMIYFKLETVQRVVKNIYDCLAEGGYFFAGYAETLNIISHKFQVERNKETFYYQKNAVSPEPIKPRLFPTAAAGNRMQNDKVQREISAAEDSYKKSLELYIKEDYQSALVKIKEYLDANSSDQRALLLLSRIYIERQMLTAALATCQELVKLDPLSAKVCYLLGFIYKQQKDVNNAVAYFKKVIFLDRDFVLAYYHLAFLYKDVGENEKALREFTNALRIFEKYSSAEPLEFGGGFTPKILVDICRKNIADLQSDEIAQ